MPEPDNFTPTEQFQDVNKRIWNKLVREYFKDVSALEDDLDLTTPRQALLKSCLHKEDDQLLLTIGRMLLFLHGTSWLKNQYPIVVGNLLNDIDASVAYHPTITLYFREDESDAEAGYEPVDMETSFRITNYNSNTITIAYLKTIAQKIKTNFGANNGYIFKKGRKIVYYTDKSKGYDFRVYSRSLEEGKQLIIKVLNVNSDSFDSKLLRISEVDNETEAFPYNPGTQIILGKRKNKPRRRPMVNVKFKYAYCMIHGYNQPIYLYSTNYYIPQVLVEV